MLFFYKELYGSGIGSIGFHNTLLQHGPVDSAPCTERGAAAMPVFVLALIHKEYLSQGPI